MVSSPLQHIHNASKDKVGRVNKSQERWDVFVKRFNRSHDAVQKVAGYIRREKKLAVTIPEVKLASNIYQSLDYLDDGDIICHTANGREHIIEVKRNSIHFTCKEDYPKRNLIINEVAKADRINAFAYFIVNKDLSYACIVKGSTKDQWFTKSVYDSQQKVTYDAYFCPLHLGEFVKL